MLRRHWRETGTRRSFVQLALFAWLGAAVGCQTGGDGRGPDVRSPVPSERVAAVIAAAESGDRSNVPSLIGRLDDEDPVVRFCAILALEKLTGDRFGYQYAAPARERAAAVDRWRRYTVP